MNICQRQTTLSIKPLVLFCDKTYIFERAINLSSVGQGCKHTHKHVWEKQGCVKIMMIRLGDKVVRRKWKHVTDDKDASQTFKYLFVKSRYALITNVQLETNVSIASRNPPASGRGPIPSLSLPLDPLPSIFSPRSNRNTTSIA